MTDYMVVDEKWSHSPPSKRPKKLMILSAPTALLVILTIIFNTSISFTGVKKTDGLGQL